MSYKLIQGDCIEVMANAKAESVDAIVTDGPYGISFMGKDFDTPGRMVGAATGVSGGFNRIPPGTPRPDMSKSDPHIFQSWCEAWATQAIRVLKPGGHLLSFGATRAYHRMVSGVEDAGFEIRDMIGYLYSSGFPKSKNVAMLIDKELGHGNRGRAIPTASSYQASDTDELNKLTSNPVGQYQAKTDEAKPYEGHGTCLKPAIEPIVLARKPRSRPGKREGSTRKATTAQNVLEHGVGSLDIDGCRIGDEVMVAQPGMAGWNGYRHEGDYQDTDHIAPTVHEGRFPANLVLESEDIDENLARYFFCSKPSTKERRAGLPEGASSHPTMKPLELMRYLCRLVTPPNGVILDPFMGSGSTGIAALLEGFRFVGIEREEEYMRIAEARIAHWSAQ